MPTFTIGQNRVAADDPEADDQFVQVVWFGPSEDERTETAHHGPLRPIADYDASVRWAIELAGQLEDPVYVLPMTAAAAFRTEAGRKMLACLDEQDRAELRRQCAAVIKRIMSDCDDEAVRAEAADLLTRWGVASN